MALQMERPGFLTRWTMRLVLTMIVFVMLFPFVYVVAVSFSSYRDVQRGGAILFPANPNLDAYRTVLTGSAVPRALGVSTIVTVVGTAVNLFMTATMAYGLSRKGVPGRGLLLWMVLFTMLFGPALIPLYLIVRQVGLIDSLWALIVPGAINAFNLVIMRNFFMSIPEELLESARLDGASDPQVLWHITLPLSRAVMAVIGLFYAVSHWNGFFEALLYLNDPRKWPIQVVLRQYVLQGQTIMSDPGMLDPSRRPPPVLTIQMAVVVIATVPILLVYPFLQKYFSKGVLSGAIKG